MKKIIRSMAALGVLLFAGAAQAQTQSSGVHTHDGFYLQMDLGLGGLGSSAEDAGTDVDYSGTAGQFSIGLGAALTPNFLVGGQLWGVSADEPELEVDGEDLGDVDATLSISGIGVQLVYYFMPINLYLSATPSLTVLSLDDGDVSGDSEVGFGVKLAVGKEWWVSDNWALGLNGQVALASNDDSDEEGAPTWDTAWFGVAFSATFD